jgi:hypothetical protein
MVGRNPFIGKWVYRSLYNTANSIQKLDDLLLWEAVLTVVDDGPDLVSGTLSAGGYTLNVHGAVDRSQA